MSILSLASGQSAYRGYEYALEDRVGPVEEREEGVFSAPVRGSGGAVYDVTIDIDHPRKSHCTCPHTAGRRVICKHMTALYFTVFPAEAMRYVEEQEALRAAAEQRQRSMEDEVVRCVRKMKKAELQETLLALLFEGPEWQLERFADTFLVEEEDEEDGWF